MLFRSVSVQGSDGESEAFYLLAKNGQWLDQKGTPINLNQSKFPTANILTLNLLIRPDDGVQTLVEDLGYSPDHPRWIGSVLREKPDRRSEDLSNPIALVASNPAKLAELNGLIVRQQLFSAAKANGADSAPKISIQKGVEIGRAHV